MSNMKAVQSSYPLAPAIGYNGMLATGGDSMVLTALNAEASAEIAFGRGVAFKLSSPTTDYDVLLPAANTDKIFGIAVHSHSHSSAPDGDLGTVGIKPDGTFDVIRSGLIMVVCENGCAVGDRLFVRAVSAEDGTEFHGGLRSAADSTDCVDCTKQGQWMTKAAAGGLAWLQVDFVNEPD